LLHLIRFGLRAVALEIELLLDFRFREYVVTSARPLYESECKKQSAQIFEANVRIAPATEDLFESLFVLLKPQQVS